MTRKIIYISGTRADYGLMSRTLKCLHAHADISLSVAVTGMHLSEHFGLTVREIERDQLPICGRIEALGMKGNGASMVTAISKQTQGFLEIFEREQPEAILLLGDRGEMLAATIAAIHLNIFVVHVHGGERTGTIDESIRQAISKMAHFHLVAHSFARDRLIRMGERPECIEVVGAPGLDGIEEDAYYTREQLAAEWGLSPERPWGIVVFHPIVQEYEQAGEQVEIVLKALLSDVEMQWVWFRPNSDAGFRHIDAVLDRYLSHSAIKILTHVSRATYLSFLREATVMAGNSSSGIIEAASFHLPVIDIGQRQQMRERSDNVVNVPCIFEAITAVLNQVRSVPRKVIHNLWGDGHSAERITKFFETRKFDVELLQKCNSY